MTTKSEKPSVLLVNPLNPDRGHPVDDDQFMAECISPLTGRFLAATSPRTAQRIRERFQVPTYEIPLTSTFSKYPRIRLLQIAFELPARGFRHVVFQSFEEVSTLVFMLLHPLKQVHLIVTGNLRPDRLKRHPILGRFFLRAVFRRAATIVVHSQCEKQRVCELVPGIDPQKLLIEPHHQMGLHRDRVSWTSKSNSILFLGPECPHKKLDPVVQLIKADTKKRYRYVLSGMRAISPDVRAFLESQDNVDIIHGHLPDDDYYRLFRKVAFVMLTHDHGFEGVASGAFLDAIACGTAVIARDMSPHSEHFATFGPMGFLVNYSDPDWPDAILSAEIDEVYADFADNMNALSESCSINAVREVLSHALNTTVPEGLGRVQQGTEQEEVEGSAQQYKVASA